MLTFWVNVYEEDIERYARSLVLAPFMSHLRMEPFLFSKQNHNADGREPLIVLYSGDGRLEEILLKPEKHAIPIISSLDAKVNSEKIGLPDGPLWTWGVSEDTPELRLYFVPLDPHPGIESPDVFESGQAYLSVSRKELFVSDTVIQLYLDHCCKMIVAGADDINSLPELTRTPGGLRFQRGRIGGEWIVSMDSVMDDLLLFSRIKRAAQYLEPTLPIDWHSGDITYSERGIYVSVKNEANEHGGGALTKAKNEANEHGG